MSVYILQDLNQHRHDRLETVSPQGLHGALDKCTRRHEQPIVCVGQQISEPLKPHVLIEHVPVAAEEREQGEAGALADVDRRALALIESLGSDNLAQLAR